MISLSNLPDAVLLEILRHLDPFDLGRLSRVCRSLRNVTRDGSLWRDVNFWPRSLQIHKLKAVSRAYFPPNLRSLSIRGFLFNRTLLSSPRYNISKAFLQDLCDRYEHLQELGLIEVDIRQDIVITDLPPTLVTLSLRGSQLKNHLTWFRFGDKSAKPLPHLLHLDLCRCTGIANGVLQHLCQWTNLQSLNLAGCFRVNDAGIKLLAARLTGLVSLELSDTGITDASMNLFAERLFRLRELNVCDTQVSDEGVEAICVSKMNLVKLSLAKTAITDYALALVRQTMTDLSHLNLANSRVTEEAIQLFRSSRPNCNVEV